MDLFVTQLHDVLTSQQLPLHRAKNVVLHSFSMGCYISLNYCVKYKPFKHCRPTETEKGVSPVISKLILQSPWDGSVASVVRALMHVPLLLRAVKPSDMSGIKSVKALKQILLHLDRDRSYRQLITQFAALIIGLDAAEL